MTPQELMNGFKEATAQHPPQFEPLIEQALQGGWNVTTERRLNPYFTRITFSRATDSLGVHGFYTQTEQNQIVKEVGLIDSNPGEVISITPLKTATAVIRKP